MLRSRCFVWGVDDAVMLTEKPAERTSSGTQRRRISNPLDLSSTVNNGTLGARPSTGNDGDGVTNLVDAGNRYIDILLLKFKLSFANLTPAIQHASSPLKPPTLPPPQEPGGPATRLEMSPTRK